VYHDLERYEDATKDFDLAIGIDPDNPDFLLARVRSLLVRRVADQSIRDCTKVIRTDPGHALAYMLRREAHLLRGDPEAAEADRRAAAAIDPEGVEAWDDGDESE
jgi:tetratricopeptide (TPR) repeat protein